MNVFEIIGLLVLAGVPTWLAERGGIPWPLLTLMLSGGGVIAVVLPIPVVHIGPAGALVAGPLATPRDALVAFRKGMRNPHWGIRSVTGPGLRRYRHPRPGAMMLSRSQPNLKDQGSPWKTTD